MSIGGKVPVPPARASQIRRPAETAVFGDGAYALGANKFMRSPFPSPGEILTSGRWGGTQAFRHRGRTNVAFADGHVDLLGDRFTETLPGESAQVAPGTGFLSGDNSRYDLD
jgi:prepilin-type processing-associated H-X9-DG protein